MIDLPKPWPMKPPKWAEHCDCSVVCPTPEECEARWARMVDPGGTIHNHYCQNPPTETCWWGMEVWVCEHHAEELEAKGKVARNPRRKKGATQ